MGSARTTVFWGLLAAAVCLTGSNGPANAFDVSRTIHLSNGVTINVGPFARVVERAVDQGRLEGLAEGYLSQDLAPDAAAVLTYAVRYRPGSAAEVAAIAASAAGEYKDPNAVTLIFSTLAAEPVMLREILAEALEGAVLPETVRSAGYFAIGLPQPDRQEMVARTEDVSAETDGQPFESRSAGEVFGGSVLPETLQIGSGPGGAPRASEAGGDGGAS